MSQNYVIGRLTLALDDIIRQHRWDAYALHRIMLNHFPPEEGTTIAWVQDGGSRLSPTVTFVTNRIPRINRASADIQTRPFPVEILKKGDRFGFAIDMCACSSKKNPDAPRSFKIARTNTCEWFAGKSEDEWGFKSHALVDAGDCSSAFRRMNRRTDVYENIKISGRSLRGVLEVVDEEKFRKAVLEGIGARRNFGYGLLRLTSRA